MERFTLRPYQEQAVQNAVEMLKERGNSLIVAGTGAGKTIMMAAAIGRYANGFYAENKRRPHVLVLVHRTEIHDQNHTKFSNVCPELATSEITATRKSLHGFVHFGMVQTVVNLLDDFANVGSYFDLIVIDEAHHAKASTYETIINWNKQGKPNACLLGVTATPNRGDKLPLIELFDNFNQITSKFLINSHYLVRPKFIDLTPIFLQGDAEEKGHLSKHIEFDIYGTELIRELCKKYLAVKEQGKTVIFAPNHAFCSLIYDILKQMGRKPVYLSLGLDEISRKEELEKFEKGDSTELINVDICTEGYDFPELRNLVDFDTNGTQGQWIQKVGRVLRTAPNKTSCTVIDFGGNIDLYPDGVETDVNLNGVIKKPKGERLNAEDLFTPRECKAKSTTEYIVGTENNYTPYNPPGEFETVLDKDFGIVFVECGPKNDCIIVKKDDTEYIAFYTDKESIKTQVIGDFNTMANNALNTIGGISKPERTISKLQIALLAPEYATTALDWYGANCCICWKTWKKEIKKRMNKNSKQQDKKGN